MGMGGVCNARVWWWRPSAGRVGEFQARVCPPPSPALLCTTKKSPRVCSRRTASQCSLGTWSWAIPPPVCDHREGVTLPSLSALHSQTPALLHSTGDQIQRFWASVVRTSMTTTKQSTPNTLLAFRRDRRAKNLRSGSNSTPQVGSGWLCEPAAGARYDRNV